MTRSKGKSGNKEVHISDMGLCMAKAVKEHRVEETRALRTVRVPNG
jgi:hypothetical protein